MYPDIASGRLAIVREPDRGHGLEAICLHKSDLMKHRWYSAIGLTLIIACLATLLPILATYGFGGQPKPPKRVALSQSRNPRPPSDLKPAATPPAAVGPTYAVLAYNDPGMHCMNPMFGGFCLLPPFNTMHATVIKRGSEPQIVTSNTSITVNYSVPGNTSSSNKTDFWVYALQLFGVNPALNIGLTGNGLSGKMIPLRNDGRWEANGIPITDKLDPVNGATPVLNPFPVSRVEVRDKKRMLFWPGPKR